MSSDSSSNWLKLRTGFICAGSKPLNGGEDGGECAIAVGFSNKILSQWEQLNGSLTVSLMCSLVTNQQIVNNNLLWGVSEQHFFIHMLVHSK